MTPAPDWLSHWTLHGLDRPSALARFDALPAAEPAEMLGRWRGTGLPTGHPLDGLLEALGWWGKAFEPPDRAHPLLFASGTGPPVPIEPALMPAALALRLPGFARSAPIRTAFFAARPLLATRRPGARLERREFRGKAGAAMVYHRQPITDHFRRIDPDRALGLMERRGMRHPYLFLLIRAEALRR